MAAPRAERSEGLRDVGDVLGERIEVVGGKREVRRRAILGVWDVPPERMTLVRKKKGQLWVSLRRWEFRAG